MPTYNIIKLKNLTPLHIGTGKENQYDFSATDLHSDTLSSALAALRIQQGKVDDIESFLNSFTISSAFPFFEKIFFLPKFQGKVNISIEKKDALEYRKQLKKLKFIDSRLWCNLISGLSVTVNTSCLQGEFLLKDTKDFEKPYRSQVNQRVNVPRADNCDANPFFFNWTYFNKKAGLYCLTDAKDEKFTELLKLFILLGETGLGTDRNIGGGKFEVESGALDLPEIPEANQTMLLSLYIPTEEELLILELKKARYELLMRGGYMAGSYEESFRHLRKRSIYMFNVGSIFPTIEKLTGKTVNLAPEWNDEQMHPVFRSGRPFYLSVKINET
ncbi:MAG: type III-A CRISPR-associated RAMP protein Csm4 [Candidatus Azobacteroides sp.]|nr:type III-A CRISPR-associated RAMP protein Csm4 [Candidatus Azobacteroides sp.]